MNRLKLLRIDRQLSQTELAAAARIPRYVVQLAEANLRQPSVDQQSAISEVLGVGAMELFGMPEFKKECRRPAG